MIFSNLLTIYTKTNLFTMDEMTKLKISYSLRNRKKTATHSHLISVGLRGKKKSPEHKKAISDAMKKLWEQRRRDTIYRGGKTCKFAQK